MTSTITDLDRQLNRRVIAASIKNKMLEAHHLWIKTNGEEGECANFHSICLRYFHFASSILRHIDFTNADTTGAHFQNADFRGARIDHNIRNCHTFEYAKFSQDALPWLILHPKWSVIKDTVTILDSPNLESQASTFLEGHRDWEDFAWPSDDYHADYYDARFRVTTNLHSSVPASEVYKMRDNQGPF